jgi:hypothetical protein
MGQGPSVKMYIDIERITKPSAKEFNGGGGGDPFFIGSMDLSLS